MVCKTIFISFLFPILNFVLDFFVITMSSIISQYFKSLETLILPCHCVLYQILLCFQGHVIVLMGKNIFSLSLALIPMLIIKLVKLTKSIRVQDLNYNFVIFEIFLEILINVMNVCQLEGP